ncbi:MAG: 5'-3' exonuclease H3TH domain-containing protein, partial [Ectothiorhodospiraceae bacterium]
MRLYLIDASVYIFRAWFGADPGLTDDAGRPANAVDGFGNFLLDLLARHAPSHAVVAFDASLTTCFRNEIYPPYKANRPEAPEDLQRQMAVCQALTRALGMTAVSSERFEADDLLGTAASRARPDGYTMRYITVDKDYAQLVEPGDRLLDPTGRRDMDCDGVRRQLGVRPDQIPDLLGLCGDSVDNIPGVPGIGPKTAVPLLRAFGGLEGIQRNLDDVPALALRGAARFRNLLEQHRDAALLGRRLATIECDVPGEPGLGASPVGGVDPEALAQLDLPRRGRRRALALTAIEQGETHA